MRSDPTKRRFYDENGGEGLDMVDMSAEEFMRMFQEMFAEVMGGQKEVKVGCARPRGLHALASVALPATCPLLPHLPRTGRGVREGEGMFGHGCRYPCLGMVVYSSPYARPAGLRVC